jgi:hypothetical protein
VANGRRRRRFFAWWSMEGEGEGSLLGGQWKEKEKVLLFGGQWKEKEKVPFYLLSLSPQTTLLKPSLFIL